jgi:hypothetical protein
VAASVINSTTAVGVAGRLRWTQAWTKKPRAVASVAVITIAGQTDVGGSGRPPPCAVGEQEDQGRANCLAQA